MNEGRAWESYFCTFNEDVAASIMVAYNVPRYT